MKNFKGHWESQMHYGEVHSCTEVLYSAKVFRLLYGTLRQPFVHLFLKNKTKQNNLLSYNVPQCPQSPGSPEAWFSLSPIKLYFNYSRLSERSTLGAVTTLEIRCGQNTLCLHGQSLKEFNSGQAVIYPIHSQELGFL